MTHEGHNTASGGIGAVTFPIILSKPVGVYLIPWCLLSAFVHTRPYLILYIHLFFLLKSIFFVGCTNVQDKDVDKTYL